MDTTCLKLGFTFYSFLTLGGCAAVGFGIWSQMKSKTSDLLKTVDDAILTTLLSQGAPMLITLGCILIVMGVIGCLGTLKKKSWMLLVFFIAMLIILILQVIVAVFMVVPNSVKEKSLRRLERKFLQSLEKNYKVNSSITDIWDETMNKLRCCGYKGYDDFTRSPREEEQKNLYPKQCCSQFSKTHSTCSKEQAENKKVRGCIRLLLNENITISGALYFLIGILEIVALVVSLKVYQFLKSIPDPS